MWFPAFIIGGGDPFFDCPAHCSRELRDDEVVTSLDEMCVSTAPPSAGLDLPKLSKVFLFSGVALLVHTQ